MKIAQFTETAFLNGPPLKMCLLDRAGTDYWAYRRFLEVVKKILVSVNKTHSLLKLCRGINKHSNLSHHIFSPISLVHKLWVCLLILKASLPSASVAPRRLIFGV